RKHKWGCSLAWNTLTVVRPLLSKLCPDSANNRTDGCRRRGLRRAVRHRGSRSMWTASTIGWTIAGLALLALALSGIRIAQEYQRAVVFRLGRYHSVRGPGLYYNIPLIEWQRKVDMRTMTVNVEPQESITKDSVTVKVNAVLWYRVTEPFKAILEVANFREAVRRAALTRLRDVSGQT